MSTTAQAAASRANGALSSGPVTEAGKAASAQNARKHGLCSKQFALHDAAEQAEFDALLADIVFNARAVTPAQEEVCRHIAVAMWRRRVADNLENALFDAIAAGTACAETGGGGLPSLRTLTRYRARVNRDLKEAREELELLRNERAGAFAKRVEIAKEFKEQKHIGALIERARRGRVRALSRRCGAA